MSKHPEFFRINQPHVISQIIEGEVVAINLQSGSYYSLTDTAAFIWEFLERGACPAQIEAALAQSFPDCGPELQSTVDAFLAELGAESLIIAAEENAELGATGAPTGTTVRPEKFGPPILKKFTDMQELLLLDPIHEVDATGWPLAKPDTHVDP